MKITRLHARLIGGATIQNGDRPTDPPLTPSQFDNLNPSCVRSILLGEGESHASTESQPSTSAHRVHMCDAPDFSHIPSPFAGPSQTCGSSGFAASTSAPPQFANDLRHRHHTSGSQSIYGG